MRRLCVRGGMSLAVACLALAFGGCGTDSPPAEFALAAPADGATGVPLRPTLEWEPSARATAYTLWLRANDADFENDDRLVIKAAWATSHAFPLDLKRDTTYFWRVTAHGKGGDTQSAEDFRFTTTNAPGSFFLTAPADASPDVQLRPTLRWSDSHGAAAYTLWLRADDADFEDDDRLVIDAAWTTSHAMASELILGTTYFWRIIAHNSEGDTRCKRDFRFTTIPPVPSTIVSEPPEEIWVGEEYFYQIAVTGVPTSTVDADAPDWLVFDDQALTLSGTPTTWGIHGPVTITASNGYGSDDVQVFDIYVRAALAWGLNDKGQLGDGTTTASITPVQVVGPEGHGFLAEVVAISTGFRHAVALMANGTVWAWGFNSSGRLGDGTTTDSSTPVQVKGPDGVGILSDIIAISAGGSNTVALKADRTVWAWGSNVHGRLGDGTTTDRDTPVQVKGPGAEDFLTDVAAVSTGEGHTVAVKHDGTVWAWGYNHYGQLGDGTTANRSRPVQVKGPGVEDFLMDVANVSAGANHTIALKTDGTVWAWGSNQYRQLGDGTTTNRSRPVQVKGPVGEDHLTGVQAISASYMHTVALKTEGTAWAWGVNGVGQLGDGTTSIGSSIPVQVKGPGNEGILDKIVSISAYHDYTLALKEGGTVWAWGANTHGQLGDGTTVDSSTPVQVKGPGGEGFLVRMKGVAAGLDHALAW